MKNIPATYNKQNKYERLLPLSPKQRLRKQETKQLCNVNSSSSAKV